MISYNLRCKSSLLHLNLKELNSILSFFIYMEAQQYADQYQIHFLLGEGGQANVYLGSKNNELYALKVYLPGAGKEAAYKIEADFLAKLNYRHLINMVDHRPQAKVKVGVKPEEKRPLIVLELAEGGELFQFLSKTGKFSSEVCRVYFKQILSAIRYLVSVNVAHRDLKPENILFDREFTLKVSDFGLSRDAKGNLGDYKLTSRVGTQGYKPPEMEMGNYTGLAADMFAAGVVLFIMFNGTPPFLSTKPNDRIYQLIKTKNFQKFWALHEKNKAPGHFPDAFKRLINSLLSSEIDRRPSLDDIEKDEWLCGDDIMNDDLITYMKSKSEKLSQNDPNKKKMADLRDKLLQRAMEEEECGLNSAGSRGEEDEEEDPNISEEDYFARNYRKLNIKTEELPQYENKGLVYLNQKPAFLVAWLQNHLREQQAAKEVFLRDFPSEIVPLNYTIDYNEKTYQLNAKFVFVIDDEDETELMLTGQLHRSSKGEVSIDWRQAEGTPFWLTAIQANLNDSLREIA